MFRGFKIEYNLMIIASAAGYDKFVYLKFGVQSFSHNTMIGPASYIQRHGSILYATPSSANTSSTQTVPKMWFNYMEGLAGGNAGGFLLNGAGIDFRGNYVKAGVGVKLQNGWQFNNEYEALYQAASDFTAVGNQIIASSGANTYRIGDHGSLKTDNGERGYLADQGHRIRNVRIFGHRGTAVSGISQLFFEPNEIETATCRFSTGFTTEFPDPGAAVKLEETQVGFEVTGQDGTA